MSSLTHTHTHTDFPFRSGTASPIARTAGLAPASLVPGRRSYRQPRTNLMLRTKTRGFPPMPEYAYVEAKLLVR